MRSFVAATLAMIASADQSDFPSDKWNHADCHVTASFTTDCVTLYDTMYAEIASWDPEPLETPGYYTIYESETDVYIWSQRLTYNQMYLDDQLFDFVSTGEDSCQVVGRSYSETVSFG